MDKEEALAKTKKKFTNLLDGDILPGVSVGWIISYYESLIAGTMDDKPIRDCNISRQFREDELNDMMNDLDDHYNF